MTILDTIKRHKMDEVSALRAKGARAGFRAACRDLPPPRDFTGAVAARYHAGKVALVAEIKKASPSKGVLRTDFDVAEIARAYRDGGAACLSVLTDEHFFGGHRDFVSVARDISLLPVLRKDFLIDPIQVEESRAMQADAILLILALVEDGQAHELESAAEELGLHVLIEVHDESELNRALEMNARLIGINNRNLETFDVNLEISEQLCRRIGPDRLTISESGIRGPADVARLFASGIRGFLIGETLMKAPDIKGATAGITRNFVAA
jgi:indole-3-glycerol phosphate synthase